MYGLFGKFTAQPGKRDALAAILLEAANGLRALDGCYLYVINTDPADPDALWVNEVWRSQADHQASLSLEATQTLIANGRPLIASMSDRHEVTPLGGKGLPD
ncbi:MAG: putative quinol monooxygenase [Anaerolineae bacterium]